VSGDQQTTYAEILAVLDVLPFLVRETRRRRGLSVRQVGELLDLSFSTVSRFEDGKTVHSRHLVTLLRWVAEPDGGAS
jgi:DNA-binding transcriptional regulator YiaG